MDQDRDNIGQLYDVADDDEVGMLDQLKPGSAAARHTPSISREIWVA